MNYGQEFWEGKNVLVTGALGFLGKLVVEKILRCFSNVSSIYLLIREKNVKPLQRVIEMLASPVFHPLKEIRPDFTEWALQKIVVIEGDLRQSDLGLSEESLNIIYTSNVVIHCGGLSALNTPLDLAVQTNVIGTDGLFRIAKKMKNLSSFLFVSTAFIHGQTKSNSRVGTVCDEKVVPLRFDPYKIVNSIQRTAGKEPLITPKELERYGNSHSFSKHLAENVLVHNMEGINLIIVRPSFIGATYKYPVPGYCESKNAIGKLMLYIGLGIIKFMPGDPNNILDCVPADFVVNQILSSISFVGSQPRDLRNPSSLVDAREPHIFHITSSASNPLRWGYATETMTEYWNRNPPSKAISKSSFYLIPNYAYYKQQYLFKYDLPFQFYATASRLLGSDIHSKQAEKTKKLINNAGKINSELLYFLLNEWIFSVNNSYQVLQSFQPNALNNLSLEFDVRDIDWYHYIHYFCYGVHKYVLGDSISLPTEKEMAFNQMIGGDVLSSTADHNDKFFEDLRFSLFSSYNVISPNSSSQKQKQLKSAVLNSQKIRDVITLLARDQTENKNGDQSKRTELELMSEVEKMYDRMEARMNVPTMRVMGYAFRKIWQQLYQQINVNQQGLEQVKRLVDSGASVVYMPSHRSYIDFLILAYILFAYNLPLPHIAAGEDFLGIAVVHLILRAGGAFFLRRTFKGDLLYSTLFMLYVQYLLLDKVPLEFFIEGTRSRTGKSLKPKLGLLGMITESFFVKKIEDIHFVPIHINYERLVEAEMYPNELLGQPKKKESLGALISARAILAEDYGRISIKIGKPISLKDYSNDMMLSEKKDVFNSDADRNYLNVKLGNKIIHEITEQSVWSAISLVSCILLAHKHGISQEESVKVMAWLQVDIERRGRGYFDWILEQNPGALMEKGLHMLQHIAISKRDHLIQPDSDMESCLVLASYRNRIIHLFYRDALISVAVWSAMLKGEKEITIANVIKDADYLEKLFSLEFVYKENPDEQEDFEATIRDMASQNILEISQNNSITILDKVKLEFFCSLLWPFVDSYWVVLLLLFQTKPNGVPNSSLNERASWLCKNFVGQGKIYSGESCSKDTLGNSMRSFLNLGVIRKVGDLIYLTDKYKLENVEFGLLVVRLNSFRNGGMHDKSNDITSILKQIPSRL